MAKKDHSLVILAIIAIIGILALVLLFRGGDASATGAASKSLDTRQDDFGSCTKVLKNGKELTRFVDCNSLQEKEQDGWTCTGCGCPCWARSQIPDELSCETLGTPPGSPSQKVCVGADDFFGVVFQDPDFACASSDNVLNINFNEALACLSDLQ